MAHEDAGRYSAKRNGVKLDETIAKNIKDKISESTISCAEAHSLAGKLNVDPGDVGTTIDLLEVRIVKCQLGLFGHGAQKNQKNLRVFEERTDGEIETAIGTCLVNGRLPCATAWEIAKSFNVTKATISSLCERMKIKISPCQLGAFG